MQQPTAQQTATIVKIPLERTYAISEDTANFVRQANIRQIDELFTRAQVVWGENLDGIVGAEQLTPQHREQFGAFLWLLGDMRERVSDLLYLTPPTEQEAQYRTAIKADPATHEGSLR